MVYKLNEKESNKKKPKMTEPKKQKQQKDNYPSWHTRMATVDKMDNVCFS